MDRFEIEDLTNHIFEVDENNEITENKIYEFFMDKCDGDLEQLVSHVIKKLTPMIQVASSAITKTTYKGFGIDKQNPGGKPYVEMLLKIKVENENNPEG